MNKFIVFGMLGLFSVVAQASQPLLPHSTGSTIRRRTTAAPTQQEMKKLGDIADILRDPMGNAAKNKTAGSQAQSVRNASAAASVMAAEKTSKASEKKSPATKVASKDSGNTKQSQKWELGPQVSLLTDDMKRNLALWYPNGNKNFEAYPVDPHASWQYWKTVTSTKPEFWRRLFGFYLSPISYLGIAKTGVFIAVMKPTECCREGAFVYSSDLARGSCEWYSDCHVSSEPASYPIIDVASKDQKWRILGRPNNKIHEYEFFIYKNRGYDEKVYE